MEKIIEIDLLKINDLLEKYNSKKVSKKLIDYIIEETPEFKKSDTLKIVINNKLNEKIECTKIINQALKNEYEKSFRQHFRLNLIQLLYLIIGVISLFLSTLIEKEVFKEVVLICGWVPIWAMVEIEIFSDMGERKKRRILKKIINSEFIEQ